MHILSPGGLVRTCTSSPLSQVKTFKDYVELYLKGQQPSEEDEEIPRKVVHEVVNPRWEVAITASNSGFQQASFVNSIATTKVVFHVTVHMYLVEIDYYSIAFVTDVPSVIFKNIPRGRARLKLIT